MAVSLVVISVAGIRKMIVGTRHSRTEVRLQLVTVGRECSEVIVIMANTVSRSIATTAPLAPPVMAVASVTVLRLLVLPFSPVLVRVGTFA